MSSSLGSERITPPRTSSESFHRNDQIMCFSKSVHGYGATRFLAGVDESDEWSKCSRSATSGVCEHLQLG